MRPCVRSYASAHRDSSSRDWLKGAARPSSIDTRFATTCTWGVVPSRCATSTAWWSSRPSARRLDRAAVTILACVGFSSGPQDNE